MNKFQSPRSGKFVSDDNKEFFIIEKPKMRFQSPRSGKFVSHDSYYKLLDWAKRKFDVSIP